MTEAPWYLGRGTGVVALVLLTLSLVLGITTGRVAGWPGWTASASPTCTRRRH